MRCGANALLPSPASPATCCPPCHLPPPQPTPRDLLPLFWTCASLIVIAQVMILRSTRRAFRGGAEAKREAMNPEAGLTGTARRGQSAALEWAFAVGPAVAIAFLLFFTWRAASRPPVMEVRFDGLPVSQSEPAPRP